MGFLKKIGRGISKGIKKLGKGVSKVLNSTVGKVATTVLQFVPGVGIATKILGGLSSLNQKQVFPFKKSGSSGNVATPVILDAGNGALLWKFSQKKDTWELQKGNPVDNNKWNATVTYPKQCEIRKYTGTSKRHQYVKNISDKIYQVDFNLF